MPDNVAADTQTDALSRLEQSRANLSALEAELTKLSQEGDRIRNDLRGLIDRVKIAKVKSYIDKTV